MCHIQLQLSHLTLLFFLRLVSLGYIVFLYGLWARSSWSIQCILRLEVLISSANFRVDTDFF